MNPNFIKRHVWLPNQMRVYFMVFKILLICFGHFFHHFKVKNIAEKFLHEMMENMNFSPKWRMWIIECVSTAHGSVLVTGRPSGGVQN